MSSNLYLKLKEKAVALRKSGKSYNEIRRTLSIKSKGTISYWLKNLELSSESKKLLSKNILIAHKRGLFTANEKRGKRIQTENSRAYEEGIRKIGKISQRELLIAGVCLYWGEGTKSEKNYPRLAFSNSDPLMIAFYLTFLRRVLFVKEENIRAGIHLYPSAPVEKTRNFWAHITGLNSESFYIINQVSKASMLKRDSRFLPYGTAVIRVNGREFFYKMKGMIKGISNSSGFENFDVV